MAGKNSFVTEFFIRLDGAAPRIEGLFSHEDVDAMVDKVLRNEHSLIGQCDHQGILSLSMLDPDKFEARPVDRFNSWRNNMLRPLGVRSNSISAFLVLLRSH